MNRDFLGSADMAEDLGTTAGESQLTGRQLVIFKERDEDEAASGRAMRSFLHNKAGLRDIASVTDASEESFEAEQFASAESVDLERLGIAIVSTDPERTESISRAATEPESPVQMVVPERYDRLFNNRLYADDPLLVSEDATAQIEPRPTTDDEELGALEDPAVVRRVGRLLRFLVRLSEAMDPEVALDTGAMATPQVFSDSMTATWGLIATRVPTSRYAGRGVRVAVLDTGFAQGHPDFVGRRIVSLSVVPGVSPQDINGHGTHCIGTACGPLRPTSGPRYGVAWGAEIFSYKVFNNAPQPGARQGDVITAMGLANQAGCRVISLSLGSDTNGAVNPAYEQAIHGVRRAGSLVVCASGNAGLTNRPRTGAPANSPSAISVGAIDPSLRCAGFSSFGKVDIAAPGVNVLSSFPQSTTRRLSGTSMATPHVAGIVAMLIEQNRYITPDQLELALQRMARSLAPQRPSRVGHGLIQAPQ